MLETHLDLCLGITDTISCHIRLTSWPKPSKCAATAHTDLPLSWKDKSCCCSNGGFRGTEIRGGRQRPTWEPTVLPGLIFYSCHLAGPSLQFQAQPCSQGSGPLCTHGTHENPMPYRGVTGQAGNPSSSSLRLWAGLQTW